MDRKPLLGLAGVIVAAMTAEFNDQVSAIALVDIRGALGISHDPGTWIESLYVAELERLGCEVAFVRTDVSDPASVEALIQTTVERFGRLDCAFNNAGILPPTASLADISVEEFDRVIAIDLKGVFLCMKYEIQHMLRSGSGSIVNTASVAGLVADPEMSPYTNPH